MITIAIDTTSDLAGVALFDGGSLLGEVTWRAHQSHSRDLLPTLDWLLQRARLQKSDLGAVFVCLGPGSYAGMRVGVSTAKALAFGLGLPVAGVGRLEADAYSIAAVTGGRVVALHTAGRAELAWGVYQRAEALSPRTPSTGSGQALTLSQRERELEGGKEAERGREAGKRDTELQELEAPRLGPADRLIERTEPGDIVCGEIEKLNDELRRALLERGARLVEAPASRALSVARLGLQRLARGDVDNADALVPMYLRAPAIGPQPAT
jgi:tRNA threonylcarbamoyl adenosine modification protein YeaZ